MFRSVRASSHFRSGSSIVSTCQDFRGCIRPKAKPQGLRCSSLQERSQRSLKNLRPETARKLFQAKIVPLVDYASPIWSPGLSASLINKLNLPQKIGVQAIKGAFRTVASTVAESEAGLETPTVRHHKQQLRSWLRSHTKPLNHRFWKSYLRLI